MSLDVDYLIDMTRTLEKDHNPYGWPPVRMREMTGLANEVEMLRNALDKYRWRDVNEEPPEEYEDCIGRWWKNGKEKCYLGHDGQWFYYDKNLGKKVANIAPTHWMPMPEFEEVE